MSSNNPNFKEALSEYTNSKTTSNKVKDNKTGKENSLDLKISASSNKDSKSEDKHEAESIQKLLTIKQNLKKDKLFYKAEYDRINKEYELLNKVVLPNLFSAENKFLLIQKEFLNYKESILKDNQNKEKVKFTTNTQSNLDVMLKEKFKELAIKHKFNFSSSNNFIHEYKLCFKKNDWDYISFSNKRYVLEASGLFILNFLLIKLVNNIYFYKGYHLLINQTRKYRIIKLLMNTFLLTLNSYLIVNLYMKTVQERNINLIFDNQDNLIALINYIKEKEAISAQRKFDYSSKTKPNTKI